jgi:hypothetical protein
MSIPLVSNIGFTEVDSAGNLNEKAGTDKVKLPVQLFKLTDNISGNLTMAADSAHKKIILDTNGKNIINDTGSPLTNNSSTAIDLKGSGEVQSRLKTFSSVQTSSSATGTTTIPTADNSTVVVAVANFFGETSRTLDFKPGFGQGPPNSISGFGIADGQTGGSNSFGNAWRIMVPSGQTWRLGSDIVSGRTQLTGGQNNIAIGAANGFNKITAFFVTVDIGGDNTQSFPVAGGGYNGNSASWASSSPFAGDSNKNNIGHARNLGNIATDSGTFARANYLVYNKTNGRWEGWHSSALRTGGGGDDPETYATPTFTFGHISTGRRGNGPPPQSMTINVEVEQPGRSFTFTNNLAISCTLNGSNPFNGISCNAGASVVANRSSNVGTFNISGTIGDQTDGSGRPFALKDINDGTGSVNEDAYTGTKSVSAF